jgi:leader peptidase (prepilin peptidase)/N-methyltransferase
MIPAILVFLFGSAVGSFLNVCIHRMPLNESLNNPARSYCPKCRKTILWYDNIPFLSYILLRGKCRFCGQGISARYFLVELCTALIFLLFFDIFGSSFNLFFYSLFACGLIVATFVDIQHRIIPDEISLGGIVVGFILSAARGLRTNPFSYDYWPMINSFLGIVLGGGIIFLTGLIFDIIYFKLLKRPAIQGETESMGGGDVKLLAMIGSFLGWQRAILVFFLAPILGLGLGIINLIAKKDHTIPYGPFLSLAAFLSILWADKIFYLLFWRWVY